MKYRIVSANSSLPGIRIAMSNCPPTWSRASKSSTSCPRPARVVAAASPAGPAPTTATLRAVLVGSMTSSVSYPALGLTRQVARCLRKVWSRHAWLHAMHVLISSARPCSALRTNSGSARNGRARDTRSAPPESTCSATSGVLIRLVAQTGIRTCSLSRAA